MAVLVSISTTLGIFKRYELTRMRGAKRYVKTHEVILENWPVDITVADVEHFRVFPHDDFKVKTIFEHASFPPSAA